MRKSYLSKIFLIITGLLFFAVLMGYKNGNQKVFPNPDWKEASPESQGIDSNKLSDALKHLEQNCGRDGISQTLIIKNGYLIWQGGKIDSVHNVWSCTKSFSSTVLGLLIEEEKCQLDDLVMTYLPELSKNYPLTTFRHFATMTSGYTSKGDKEATGHGQSKTPFLPEKPLFNSGTEFRYWDSAMNEFGNALSKVAKGPIENVFREKVANPIGMNPVEWHWGDWGEIQGIKVNGGAGNKSKGINISARELAKFAYLFLNEGNWKGKQLISEKWVAMATSVQVSPPIIQESNGTSGIGNYGFNWWLHPRWPDSPKGTYAAAGYNNNMCFVVPEWNMVIVRLGMDGNIDDKHWNTFFRMLSEINL